MSKTLYNLNLNIWKRDEFTVQLTVKHPETGEEFITTVESTEKRNGKHMARTHNNLFNSLKTMLINSDKWNT